MLQFNLRDNNLLNYFKEVFGLNVSDRIAKLRSFMEEKHIDAYVVPSADNHQSEYVGEHFKSREFITGFTGSAGTAVITKDAAGLWTDGRYFIQAAPAKTLISGRFDISNSLVETLGKSMKLFCSTKGI